MDALPKLGRNHPLLRKLRRLRRERRERDAGGWIWAEGPRLAGEALAAGVRIRHALVAPRLHDVAGGRKLVGALLASGADVAEVADSVLDGLQDARSAQPVLLLAERVPERPPARDATTWITVLWGVQDPGNLGTIWRTAAAAGGSGIVVCGGADPYHPRAIRASAGAVFRLPVWQADGDALLVRLADEGIPSWTVEAGSGEPYFRAALEPPLALHFGSEGGGLPARALERARGRISIPMAPGAESLSVGAAAAVVLFDAARRSRGAG